MRQGVNYILHNVHRDQHARQLIRYVIYMLIHINSHIRHTVVCIFLLSANMHISINMCCTYCLPCRVAVFDSITNGQCACVCSLLFGVPPRAARMTVAAAVGFFRTWPYPSSNLPQRVAAFGAINEQCACMCSLLFGIPPRAARRAVAAAVGFFRTWPYPSSNLPQGYALSPQNSASQFYYFHLSLLRMPSPSTAIITPPASNPNFPIFPPFAAFVSRTAVTAGSKLLSG